MIAVVHNPTENSLLSETETHVLFMGLESTVNYIKVPWARDPITGEEVWPNVDINCGNEFYSGPCTTFI